jgi:hypothetical protein
MNSLNTGADNCAVIQELPSILWISKVHYRVYKSPLLVPFLRHINPIHTIPSYFCMMHFNIPVRFPDEVDCFNLPNTSNRTMVMGSTQLLTKMSIRNLPGGKMRPARRADKLATICEPSVCKCGSLNVSQT